MDSQLNIHHKILLQKINLLQRIDFSNIYLRLHQIQNIFQYLDSYFAKIHSCNSEGHLKFVEICKETAINLLSEINTITVAHYSDKFFTESLIRNTKFLLQKYINENKKFTNPKNPQEL